MFSKDTFDKINEADLRSKIIVPLLQATDYKDVFLWHGGSGEQGKDVVCWKPSDLDKRENLAIVAKAVKTSGQAKLDKGTAAEIQTQIRQCFGKTYNAPGSLEDQWIHRVWVVSNKAISKETQDAVKSSLNDNPMMVRSIEFVDGDKLWHLVEKYLGISVLAHAKELQKKAAEVDSHYKPRFTINDDNIEVTVVEKFPGAAQEKPMVFKTVFPSEMAAESFHAILQRYQETGEPAEIPSELVESIELPEFIKAMLGIRPDSFKLSLTSPPMPTQIPVRLKISCDDGDEYVREYLTLRGERVGSKEAVLVTEEKEAPFRLKIEIKTKENSLGFSECNFTASPRQSPYNAVQHWEWLCANKCLGKPCQIQIDNVETGINIFDIRSESGMAGAPHPGLVDFYWRLAVVQQKTKELIFIPDRDLTTEEVELIEQLYQIVTVGRFEGTWNNLVLSFIPPPEHTLSWLVDDLKKKFPKDRPEVFTQEQEEIATLFDTVISLGPVRKTAYNVSFDSAEILHNFDMEEGENNTLIQALFTPVGEARALTEYINWLPLELRPLPLATIANNKIQEPKSAE